MALNGLAGSLTGLLPLDTGTKLSQSLAGYWLFPKSSTPQLLSRPCASDFSAKFINGTVRACFNMAATGFYNLQLLQVPLSFHSILPANRESSRLPEVFSLLPQERHDSDCPSVHSWPSNLVVGGRSFFLPRQRPWVGVKDVRVSGEVLADGVDICPSYELHAPRQLASAIRCWGFWWLSKRLVVETVFWNLDLIITHRRIDGENQIGRLTLSSSVKQHIKERPWFWLMVLACHTSGNKKFPDILLSYKVSILAVYLLPSGFFS